MKPVMAGAWRSVGASAVGVSHRRTGQPCQDAFHHLLFDEETVVAAVADGAGSATMGGHGAEIASRTAVEFITTMLAEPHPRTFPAWQQLFEGAVAQTQEAIQEQAASTGRSSRDFASTLLMVVAHSDWVVCGSVGDCAAVIQDRRGNLESLCPPQRGEYANATHFVTGSNAQSRLTVRLHSFPPLFSDFSDISDFSDRTGTSHKSGGSLRHIAIFSDGLLELALNVACNRPFPPFFEPLFAFASDVAVGGEEAAAKDLAAFLDSDRINSRTHDDKTLLLLTNFFD